MNKQSFITILLTVFMSIIGAESFAFEIEVKNDEGVTIYYNYINDGKDLEVTIGRYIGNVAIPEEVTYMNKTHKVTSIGNSAFANSSNLTSVTIPRSVNSIREDAFSGCGGLTSLSVANGNMVYDSRYNCNAIIETATNTLLIGCKNTRIPYSVKTIGSSAFANCKELETIEIPKTVTEIGYNAFAGSGLKSIDIPNSVTYISSGAFSECKSLSSAILSDNLTSIEYATFANCSSLSSFTIPNCVTFIGDRAFENCRNLSNINIPNSVNHIGDWAFAWCHSLTSIVLPSNITEIKSSTLYFCINLESVIIPKSVTKIDGAFSGCHSLSNVYCFAEEVPEGSPDIVFPVIDNNTTLHVPAASIEKYKRANVWSRFGNIVALTEEELVKYDVNSPENIIDQELSRSVEGFYITQPNSYRIRQGAQVEYGNSYETMIIDNGDGTYNMDDLLGGWYCQRAGYGPNYALGGTLTIGESGNVSCLESYVPGWGDSHDDFTGTYDAEKGIFKVKVIYAGMDFVQTWVKDADIIKIDGINYRIKDKNTVSVTKGNYSGEIVIPNEVSYKDNSYSVSSIAIGGSPALTSVVIPNSVTSIDGAFLRCTALTSVVIPNSVTSINGAFRDCPALTSVDIPNSLTSIGDNAFNGCSGLKKVNIPNCVIFIGEDAFYGCTSLNELILPNSITTIGKYSFSDCNSLKSLTIPKSVLTIENCAFYGCESLESIEVDSENIKYDSRGNCNAIIETYTDRLILGCKNTVIPQDVKTIGEDAFARSIDMKNLYFPNSVTAIEMGAFSGCKGLNTLNVGNNVEIIESYAFQECSGIQSVIIPQKVKSIGYWTFRECIGLKDFYCYAECLPTTHAEAFIETPIENATLHVPAVLVETYKNSSPWSGFGKIVALTDEDPKPSDMKCGDINGDGVVNAADIVCIVNIIKQGATEADISIADLNGDGLVNKDDVEVIAKIIMANK